MERYEMVAKTFMGLEDVLAEELRALGALNVEPGKRMVQFEGTLETMYRANMCCRTALRILKPICKFVASDPDELYDRVKEYDWSTLLSPEKTFSVDTTIYSDEFPNSRYVVYRVKDAIVDWFQDRLGAGHRPGVRLKDADISLNVHIAGGRVVVSLDSSGESLHKRGWRVAQTDAPINEVMAAGIILKSGWRGDCPLVDPMCGSGTFLIEAAMIAANIMPGIYRRHFAFETWPDFDRELLDSIYNDDSQEREVTVPIVGADNLAKAIAITRKNAQSAGVAKYLTLELRDLKDWTPGQAPAGGVMVTNPPYGERLKPEELDELYATLGSRLKHVFQGYHAWVIGYRDEQMRHIGLAPSQRIAMMNGPLECELREYVIFEGDYRTFRRDGGHIKSERKESAPTTRADRQAERRRKFGDKKGAPEGAPKKVRGLKGTDKKPGAKGAIGAKGLKDRAPKSAAPKDGAAKVLKTPQELAAEARRRAIRAIGREGAKQPSLAPTMRTRKKKDE